MIKSPQLHDFEIEELVDNLGPNLQLILEYNTDICNDLYVSEDAIQWYGSTDEYEDQRPRTVEFLRMDFIDRHAYGDIVPKAGDSELFVTQAANVLLVRFFNDDDALFVSIERNGSIGQTVDTIEAIVR